MYYYDIGYTSYEDSLHKVLTHEKEFTKSELDDIVAEGIKDLYQSILDKDDEDYDYSEISCFYTNDLESNIYDWLIKNKGFNYLRINANSFAWGWYNVKRGGWEKEIANMPLMQKIVAKIRK